VKRFVFPVVALCVSLLAVAVCLTSGQWLAALGFGLSAVLAFDLAAARSAALHYARRAWELDSRVPDISSLDGKPAVNEGEEF
jgi:uncharacterized membrane protein